VSLFPCFRTEGSTARSTELRRSRMVPHGQVRHERCPRVYRAVSKGVGSVSRPGCFHARDPRGGIPLPDERKSRLLNADLFKDRCSAPYRAGVPRITPRLRSCFGSFRSMRWIIPAQPGSLA